MLYSYFVCNGHILCDVDNQFFLVDTGSQYSFGANGLNSVLINGKKFRLYPFSMLSTVTLADMNTFIGHTIDGIIGRDILDTFNGLTFLKNGYGGVEGNKIDFDNFHFERARNEKRNVLINMTITDVKINGGNIGPTYLDTGAHFPMVASSIFAISGAHSMLYSAMGKTISTDRELTLSAGWQTIDRKTIDIEFNDVHFYEALAMTPSIERGCMGYKCFLGITELFEDYFCFDFKNKQIQYC